MASKAEILQAIRQHQLPQAPLPNLKESWVSYPNRPQRFAELVERVGGRCLMVSSIDQIRQELQNLPQFAQASKTISLTPDIISGNVDLNKIDDPHQLEDIDFVIARGEFGVAENGAIWITDRGAKHRVVFFLTQHLSLVVNADQIVDNMHQAYEKLSFDNQGYGIFISGPSKTADIEQALVIGAHGPRSLTVFCLKG